MKYILLLFWVICFNSKLFAQKSSTDSIGTTKAIDKKVNPPEDSFRISYQDVYDNIHYNQPLRPQVHYSPLTGQIADPTGLVRYNGIYHLFYMFDEWSRQRGENKNWGHATSSDCVHWEQQPAVLNTVVDNRPGSGNGIVDWNNTLNLPPGTEKTLALFYTDYGRGISLIYSRDAGKTWVRHKNNPLLPIKSGFRDPMVFWYKPDQSWRMVVYEEPGLSFYKSNDLIQWQFLSSLHGYYECPDILHMPVDGNKDLQKWVLTDASGSYTIGEFDGTKFLIESEKRYLGQPAFYNRVGNRTNYYTKDIYATQAFKQSYEGDGPFYQLAFFLIREPPAHSRTWSQQLIFPVELTLKTIDGKITLCRNPIDAIKQLRYNAKVWTNESVHPGQNPLEEVQGDVLEIITEIDLQKSTEIIFDIRGQKINFDTRNHLFRFMDSKVTVTPRNNRLKLHLVIDRNSIEIYAGEGEVTISRLFYPDPANHKLAFTSAGGSVRINTMEIYQLQSIWLKRELELGYQR